MKFGKRFNNALIALVLLLYHHSLALTNEHRRTKMLIFAAILSASVPPANVYNFGTNYGWISSASCSLEEGGYILVQLLLYTHDAQIFYYSH